MSAAGELRDLDLASLIQIICLSGQATALMLSRNGEEGAIFFEDGKIVQATLPTLSGESALRQLLNWTEGDFRIVKEAAAAQKPLALAWRSLFERKSSPPDAPPPAAASPVVAPVVAPSAEDVREDLDFENSLLRLLSDFEQVLVRLGERRVLRRPALAYEHLAEIATRIVKYMQTETKADFSAISLPDALRQALEHHPRASGVVIHHSHIMVDEAMASLDAWREGFAERRIVFEQTCYALLEIVGILFQHLTAGLHTTEAQERWRETYGVFLLDLTRGVNKIYV
jgi:hypothetical protein